MFKKNLLQFSFLFLVTISLSSCYYDTFPEETGPPPEGVSYSQDIQPLWDADCVSCHQGNTPPDLRAANSYNSLINGNYVVPNKADESVLYHSLTGSNGVSLMPPSNQWPSSQISIVETWINEGAKDN